MMTTMSTTVPPTGAVDFRRPALGAGHHHHHDRRDQDRHDPLGAAALPYRLADVRREVLAQLRHLARREGGARARAQLRRRARAAARALAHLRLAVEVAPQQRVLLAAVQREPPPRRPPRRRQRGRRRRARGAGGAGGAAARRLDARGGGGVVRRVRRPPTRRARRGAAVAEPVERPRRGAAACCRASSAQTGGTLRLLLPGSHTATATAADGGASAQHAQSRTGSDGGAGIGGERGGAAAAGGVAGDVREARREPRRRRRRGADRAQIHGATWRRAWRICAAPRCARGGAATNGHARARRHALRKLLLASAKFRRNRPRHRRSRSSWRSTRHPPINSAPRTTFPCATAPHSPPSNVSSDRPPRAPAGSTPNKLPVVQRLTEKGIQPASPRPLQGVQGPTAR